MPETVDVAVVGGGIAGSVMALALAGAGASVRLIDPGGPLRDDGRTTALLVDATALLRRIGLWGAVEASAAPLRRLRIVDLPADGAPPRADVTFEARELGLDVFGHNIANAVLAEAVDRALGAGIRQRSRLHALGRDGDAIRLAFDDGAVLRARLVVGADGKASLVRAAARIGCRRHDYGQTAIVAAFAHARPHADTSIELHRPGGPFTMVPVAPCRSSVVWVETTAAARGFLALDEAAFAQALATRVRPWLGKIGDVGDRHAFPLTAVLAARLAAPRVVLAGEAAHAVSPLGAQGLNLSLRDAATLAELVAAALRRGDDPGAPATVLAYQRRRRGDVAGRFWAVDALNRMVRTAWPPVGIARGLGLDLLGRLPPLRRGLMRALLSPDAVARPA